MKKYEVYLLLLLAITITGPIGYYFLSTIKQYNNDPYIDNTDNSLSPLTESECTHLIKYSKIGFPVQCAYNISNNKTIVIGVPFVFRSLGVGASYLMDTLSETLRGIPEDRKSEVQIIVLNSDMNLLRHAHLHRYMKKNFPSELNDGIIVVYSMDVGDYPEKIISDPCSLHPPEGDSLMRARWMSKLAWDTTTLMKIAQTRGKYYLQIEDDTPPLPGWFGKILDHVQSIEACTRSKLAHWEVCSKELPNKWFMIQFGKKHAFSSRFGGMFGLFWHTEDLPAMVMWIQERFDSLPVDWLVGEYTSQSGLAPKVYSHDALFNHKGTLSTKTGVDDKVTTSAYDELVSWEQCQSKKRWIRNFFLNSKTLNTKNKK